MSKPARNFRLCYFNISRVTGILLAANWMLLFPPEVAGQNSIDSQLKKSDSVVDRVVMVTPSQVTQELLMAWKAKGYQIAIFVKDASDSTMVAVIRAQKIMGSIDYFFEIARNEEVAKDHPQWMASIQGHREWTRLFKDFKRPESNEVVKVYPWVPILNQEPLDAHVLRLESILKRLPKARRIWLNDIQGAPSACGCGHTLCRWTADYGPKKTATTVGDTAPAQFVKRIQKIAGKSEVVPIMTSECEKEDQHSMCGGVGCFDGACWKAFTRQLDAVAEVSETIGVACFYKALQRDLPRYREKAGWIRYAMESFEKMPKARKGKGVKVSRLVSVLQGWNVSDDELKQQLLIAERLKPAGILICLGKVDQSWKPKNFKVE